MKLKQILVLLILSSLYQITVAQTETYTITKPPFNSDEYDEFGPAWYKNGIVFCSNKSSSISSYSDARNRSPLKINYVDTSLNGENRRPLLFSKELSSKMNDGPASFSHTFDTIYFSRNLRVEGKLKELNTASNKLGLFTAVFSGNGWERIKEYRFNSEWYNITAPSVSHDGTMLFFASDRPDGFGGSDIYYSEFRNGIWNDPVNLGPDINTTGNESFPFINEAGELFFSSDGHKGLGGKDIFVTRQKGSGWYVPVKLEPPINSEFDDFGIITDPLTIEGYFSSNRGKSIDIYHFKSDEFHFWFSVPQKENQYCFTVTDTGSIEFDALRFQSVWDFGDGSKISGSKVSHCFPGAGVYKLNHDIIDIRTGKLFFRKLSYEIEIFEIDQPFITSSEYAVAGQIFEMDGLKSFCPGYQITGYYWDFGDGTKGTGDRVNHTFNKVGEYDIRLGLKLKNNPTGVIQKRVVSKKIKVVQAGIDRASLPSVKPVLIHSLNNIMKIENIKVNRYYSAETDSRKEAVFQVVVLSSPDKVALNSSYFRNIPSEYKVKEVFDPEAGAFSYIVDEQLGLMETFPAYSEIITSGYRDAFVRINVLRDPAEKELFLIKKNYSLLTDNNFDSSNRLTTSAYIMLDQVNMLMNKYPGIKLEIGVHTDNQGLVSTNLSLSQFRAQLIANYLIGRSIGSNRLYAVGYGDTRPIASNTNIVKRRLNRRVEFTIYSE